MSFEVGDDVVVVRRDHHRRLKIIRRRLVEKVYKTGHVIIGKTEKYRQDGSSVYGDSFRLQHWTPELQAEHDESIRRDEAEAKFWRLTKVRDVDVIDAIMKLIPEEVFNLPGVKK